MATAIPFFSCKRPKSHNWHHSDLAWMDRPQTPTITWRYWPARKKWKEGVGLWAFQKLLMATYPTYPTNLFIYYIYIHVVYLIIYGFYTSKRKLLGISSINSSEIHIEIVWKLNLMKTHSHTQKLSHSSDTQFDHSFALQAHSLILMLGSDEKKGMKL